MTSGTREKTGSRSTWRNCPRPDAGRRLRPANAPTVAARIGAHAHITTRSSPSRRVTLSRSAARAWNVYNCLQGYTSMRTNIVIDDKLMRDTLRATGLKTKREAVEEGLRRGGGQGAGRGGGGGGGGGRRPPRGGGGGGAAPAPGGGGGGGGGGPA